MRRRFNTHAHFIPVFMAIALLLAACSTAAPTPTNTLPIATHPPLDPTYATRIAEQRSPDVPDLPFPDNPDPSKCGIPIEWGDEGQAWLTGRYQGEMVQPTVFLYDSHLRFDVAAKAPHGSEVQVILYQENPVTDYYFVKVEGAEQPNEGWVPGPFLSFDPVEPLEG